jgi:hypothetical protein
VTPANAGSEEKPQAANAATCPEENGKKKVTAFKDATILTFPGVSCDNSGSPGRRSTAPGTLPDIEDAVGLSDAGDGLDDSVATHPENLSKPEALAPFATSPSFPMCEKCHEYMKDQAELVKHQDRSHKHVCTSAPSCPYSFPTAAELICHLYLIHPKLSQKGKVEFCTRCNGPVAMGSWSRHKNREHKFECDVCQHAFTTPGHRFNHQVRDHGLRPQEGNCGQPGERLSCRLRGQEGTVEPVPMVDGPRAQEPDVERVYSGSGQVGIVKVLQVTEKLFLIVEGTGTVPTGGVGGGLRWTLSLAPLLPLLPFAIGQSSNIGLQGEQLNNVLT